MTRLSFPLALLIVFLFVRCNKDDEPVARTFEDTQKDFSEIDITSGIMDVDLEITEGLFYNFRVIPPTNPLNGQYPLILALHGASGGSHTAHLNTDCYIEPGLAAVDAFIISPNAGNEEWFELENQRKLFNLVQLAFEYWPIDLSKVAVVGYSNGGNASWFYAEFQTTTFSAGIPMASSYDISITDSTSRKIDTPLYVIHGENDELFPLAITQKWVEESIEAGSDIHFVVADTLSHFRPCDYVPYLQEAAVWLQEDVWK